MAPELTPEGWAQIRHDYEHEHSEKPVDDIYAEHGISPGTLRDRMRRWKWTRRLAAGPVPSREMERAASALASMTRSLRELNAMLKEQPAPAPDRGPEHDEALIRDLVRKLDAAAAAHAAHKAPAGT